MSYADALFAKNCMNIIYNGISDEGFNVRPKWEDGVPAHTKKILYAVDRYDLAKDSIPVMTMRRTAFKSCIDEILWIYQKKSNKISELNSHIWDSWDVGDGTIGKAYGYQIGKKSQYKDSDGSIVMRDQIDQVIWDLKNNPASRSILTNTYCHEDLNEMGLRPCAYMMTFNVTKDPDDGSLVLNGMLNQRSQDTLTANNWNTVQYAVLLQMLAQVCNMKPGKFVHVIADMHIYDRHIPIVKGMIENYCTNIISNSNYIAQRVNYMKENSYTHDRQIINIIGETLASHLYDFPHPNPKFWINPDIHNFYDFTVNDFKLIDYEYEPFDYKIPVAI